MKGIVHYAPAPSSPASPAHRHLAGAAHITGKISGNAIGKNGNALNPIAHSPTRSRQAIRRGILPHNGNHLQKRQTFRQHSGKIGNVSRHPSHRPKPHHKPTRPIRQRVYRQKTAKIGNIFGNTLGHIPTTRGNVPLNSLQSAKSDFVARSTYCLPGIGRSFNRQLSLGNCIGNTTGKNSGNKIGNYSGNTLAARPLPSKGSGLGVRYYPLTCRGMPDGVQ